MRAAKTASAVVSNRGESWKAPSSTAPSSAPSSAAGAKAGSDESPERSANAASLGASGGTRLPRRSSSQTALRPAVRRLAQRGADGHHGLVERREGLADLRRRAGLVEPRREPDRRLWLAHLLERCQLEVLLPQRDDAAVPHPPSEDRMRSTASVSRSSGTVSEMRKKPSPLGP